jgi:SAM-dependent methyltransferase
LNPTTTIFLTRNDTGARLCLAVLCKLLYGDECVVGDVSRRFSGPLDKHNIPCVECNLMDDQYEELGKFDVVFLLEVIEHLPVPPYVIFEKLKGFLKPGGILFLTTPNLFRLRNVIRMAISKEFLDRFMLPEPGQGLGHQLEYSASHLRWQLERAGLQIISLDHDELGRVGHTRSARIARKLLSPLTLRHKWRDGLVISAKVA